MKIPHLTFHSIVKAWTRAFERKKKRNPKFYIIFNYTSIKLGGKAIQTGKEEVKLYIWRWHGSMYRKSQRIPIKIIKGNKQQYFRI